MVYGDVSFLFMGDGEKEVENDILNDNIKADILKVGHHGFNTSSTSQFLNTVKPMICNYLMRVKTINTICRTMM